MSHEKGRCENAEDKDLTVSIRLFLLQTGQRQDHAADLAN